MNKQTISAIVPTIGRPQSLERLLISLAAQTQKPDEIIIADGSSSDQTQVLIQDDRWRNLGLTIRHVRVRPPNTVQQREAAIASSHGQLLLFLDDDVDLEAPFLEELSRLLENRSDVVATIGVEKSQRGSGATRLWKLYLRWIHGMRNREWQGKVLGPLLRFGYDPLPSDPVLVQWLPSGYSLVRRSAFEQVGGFSNFFLHRCTMNEDIDLGIKLQQVGSIYLCPKARFTHHHDPGGRVDVFHIAEDDIYNRFMILRHTLKQKRFSTVCKLVTFIAIETLSSLWSLIKAKMKPRDSLATFCGRISGLVQSLKSER